MWIVAGYGPKSNDVIRVTPYTLFPARKHQDLFSVDNFLVFSQTAITEKKK